MLQWSKYFQSPDYLDLYRTVMMDPDYKTLIKKWLNLYDGIKILDVGCGTGAFLYYLSDEVSNSFLYGIDIDELFIKRAIKKKEKYEKRNNEFHFSIGNALCLPFKDNSFDLVVSYTALTNIPDSKKVLEEMKRVLKTGGRVASVTAQSFAYFPNYDGNYKIFPDYFYEYRNLCQEVNRVFEYIQPTDEYTKYGTKPEKIPALFGSSGLHNIEMHPIGNAFSLSNSIYSVEQKKYFINMLYKIEKEKFDNYYELDEAKELISAVNADRYRELLSQRKDYQLEHIEENSIWEWFGGSQIMMIGKK